MARVAAGTKRKSLEADLSAWRNHVEPKFGDTPLVSITRAQIEQWVGSLIAGGVAPATARRYLATLRSVLAFAVADNRLTRNPAVGIRVSSTRGGRREGQFLTHAELDALVDACLGTYGDVVLGLCGLRWGELAPGLRVHDLRHTAASLWLASGADPKVVQRVLGHASAAMTMDLYGHLIDQNLWDAADRIGGTSGAYGPQRGMQKAPASDVPRA